MAMGKSELLQRTPDLMILKEYWIASEWGRAENHRHAGFYSIIKLDLMQLAIEIENWKCFSSQIGHLLLLEAKA